MAPLTRSLRHLLLVTCLFGLAATAMAQNAGAGGATPPARTYLLTPDLVIDERNLEVEVERGLLFVPENRRVAGSRLIAVHFVRFPALRPNAGRAPVFLLPGGPGWDFDLSDPLVFDEIERLRQTRDVIVLSQRGYWGAPGLTPDLKVMFPGRAPDAMISAAEQAKLDRATLGVAFQRWQARGVDLRGYDILNISDDLNDLRTALGYDKIVLRGCSFGSQWGLAYMRRWPQTVDRAMLSGVEPLDAGYDSPQDLWASMSRLAKAAEADPDLAGHIPPGGLMEALKTVISRLEAEPAKVMIAAPSGEGQIVVPVGADDLRSLLTELPFERRRALENLAQWPRFILELHGGDYRFLAARVAQRRGRSRSESLITALINHSVGTGAARAAQLRDEPAARWLGDINLKESVTRSRAPTPQVDDTFRLAPRVDVPTLMIAGDYDWSTPVENADRLSSVLKNGRVVRIQGGRHCSETNFGELSAQAPEITRKLYSFIDADFEQSPARTFFETLPSTVTLATLDFAPVSARSLYDEWLARRIK